MCYTVRVIAMEKDPAPRVASLRRGHDRVLLMCYMVRVIAMEKDPAPRVAWRHYKPADVSVHWGH